MLTIAHESTLPNPRRRWATLTSFTLQAAALALLFLFPLLQTSLLPRLDLTPRLVPIFLPRVVLPVAPHSSSGAFAKPNAFAFVTPLVVPKHVDSSPDLRPAGDPEPPCIRCIPGGGQTSIIPGGMDMIAISVVPLPPQPVAKPTRISRMMDGLLIHRVQPDYPFLAKQTRVQGAVEIAALISKEGTIENLHVTSGNPMLISAALNAVRQWRYRPYILNGDPIEVETRITVNFALAGN
jgi:periplasmic protein TonB